MAFQIVEMIESKPEIILAKVNHQGQDITVTIRSGKSDVFTVGKSFQAEIDYDEVMSWNVIDDFSDDQSGLWQGADGIHLVGRVHNVLDYGDGKTIADVYMQKGPEFFAVTSNTMEDLTFDANTGLEIVVKNLYLYPAS